MKIEKLSDKQIRCILDKSDLADRHIKISELAYGSEKAKELFQEMMRQASYELGFEAENIPLMIEAIPISSECIVLVVTKVEDPDELDTRFSKFTPEDDYYEYPEDYLDFDMEDGYEDYSSSGNSATSETGGADEVINLFNKVKEYMSKNVLPIDDDNSNLISSNETHKKSSDSNSKISSKMSDSEDIKLIRAFSFKTLDTIMDAARLLDGLYDGENSLYKDISDNSFYLLINKGNTSPEQFNKVCNILNEFGSRVHLNYASEQYIKEHYEIVIPSKAIQKLANI